MSAIQPPLDLQKFYHSLATPCPYLPGKTERKLFTELEPGNGSLVNSILTRSGFRRSHDISYRPACEGCRACTPVRVSTKTFTPSDSQKRVIGRNRDLVWTQQPAIATEEQYRLFDAYQKGRHAGGDMALMRPADYASMVETGTSSTRLYEWRGASCDLVGCMLIDEVADGMSAVYSFFALDEPRRSLGIYMVLSAIEQTKLRGAAYIYLGYFIPGSRKMEYKAHFKPMEALGSNGWTVMPP